MMSNIMKSNSVSRFQENADCNPFSINVPKTSNDLIKYIKSDDEMKEIKRKIDSSMAEYVVAYMRNVRRKSSRNNSENPVDNDQSISDYHYPQKIGSSMKVKNNYIISTNQGLKQLIDSRILLGNKHFLRYNYF